jgi:hypothetical protein
MRRLTPDFFSVAQHKFSIAQQHASVAVGTGNGYDRAVETKTKG